METNTHTQRILYDDKGNDQGDFSTSQRTPKIAGKPPVAGQEAWNRFSFMGSEGTKEVDT